MINRCCRTALAATSLALIASAGEAKEWKEAVLYSFAGESDGEDPVAGVIADKTGNLFGTTSRGGEECKGRNGCGTVFKLAPDGTETVLHIFQGGKDGAHPQAGLVADKKDNLFGVTSSGYGSVFEVTQDGAYTTLLKFRSEADGYTPLGPLIFDVQHNLYGTTAFGGITSTACDFACGTVFELTKSGTFKLLYQFQAGNDGASPRGAIVFDAAGNLYGTTVSGGGSGCSGGGGCGTVFKLAPNGTETVLHAFVGGSDGAYPSDGVMIDATGNLYGVTPDGGGSGCNGGVGCGTVFEVAPDGTETILSEFNTQGGPASPSGPLAMDESGNLFGTTFVGGRAGCGTVFELASGSQQAATIYSFTCRNDGRNPGGGVLLGAKGGLYGTTTGGGTNRCGAVFVVNRTYKADTATRPLSQQSLGNFAFPSLPASDERLCGRRGGRYGRISAGDDN